MSKSGVVFFFSHGIITKNGIVDLRHWTLFVEERSMILKAYLRTILESSFLFSRTKNIENMFGNKKLFSVFSS